ncbi:Prefoldin subunit alpha [uncultured archaeon]|nr:Prefoldin subunit alpha [uncultured archaeon]
MAEDAQAQRTMYEARLYSEQLRLLEGELERISMTAVELTGSLKAVESLREDSIFVPIGGGAMVSAKVASTEVLVPIGGGYLMNLKKHEAIEEVKKRIAATEKAMERLRVEFEKINAKLQDVNSKIEQMNAKYNPGNR